MCVGAFWLGGLICAIAQGILHIYILFVPDMLMCIAFTLCTIGLVGAIQTATGFQFKMVGVGGMGAQVPLSGFAAGITTCILMERAAGHPMGKSIIRGYKIPAILAGTAFLFGFIGALITKFAGPITLAASPPNTGVMIFIGAFIVGGIICACCQFIQMVTKLGFVGTLTVLMAFGAACGVLGWSGPMGGFAQMGFIAPLSGFAEFCYQCFMGVFSSSFISIITLILVVIFLWIVATICAIVGRVPALPPAAEETTA